MKSIDLIQAHHPYAHPPKEEQYGQIYLPTSLYTAAARLLRAGVKVRVQDENLRPVNIESENIGINLPGAPYIPKIIELIRSIRAEGGNNLRFILGGQVMN